MQLGEEIVIGKAGKPVARLVPLGAAAAMRRPGSARGRLKIHSDFDAPLCKDLSEAFGL